MENDRLGCRPGRQSLGHGKTTAPNGTPPEVTSSQLSNATIQKAGRALRDVAQIRMDYSQRMQTVQDQGQRQQLAEEAQGRQIQAVDEGFRLGPTAATIRG